MNQANNTECMAAIFSKVCTTAVSNSKHVINERGNRYRNLQGAISRMRESASRIPIEFSILMHVEKMYESFAQELMPGSVLWIQHSRAKRNQILRNKYICFNKFETIHYQQGPR